MNPPLCYVDARKFPDQVKLVYTYSYSGDGGVPGQTVTRTGSATFTYTRQPLAEFLTYPDLPETDALELFVDYLPGVAKAKFLALQLGTGFAPGWVVGFGPQDAVSDAYTVVTTTESGGTPTTTYEDQSAPNFYLTCALTAPGVSARDYAGGQANDHLVSQNVGVVPQDASGAPAPVPCTIELIVPAVAETANAATVLPVYRVTLPSDVGFVYLFNYQLNGDTYGGGGSELPTSVQGLLAPSLSQAGIVSPLSPWVADVQMYNATDVLSNGAISYVPAKKAPSQIVLIDAIVEGADRATGTFEIDPFNLAGQSHSTTKNSAGLSITISF